MKNISILLIILFCGQLLIAQETNEEVVAQVKSKIRMRGAYLMWGNRSSNYKATGVNENIETLSGGIVQFNPSQSHAYANPHGNYGTMRILMGGITLEMPSQSKSGNVHQFRAGFTYNGLNHMGQVSNYSTQLISRTYIDTITSSATGNTLPIYRDSMYYETKNATHTNRYATVDFSYVFRLHPEQTISIYGGLGLGVGIIYNATTTVTENSKHYVIQNYYFTQPQQGFMNENSNSRFDERVIRNKPGVGVDLFIPMGINLRLGKESDIWKHLSIFTEIRPTLNIQYTRETGSNSFSGTTRLFGIRAHF